jgi:hypothetical protein
MAMARARFFTSSGYSLLSLVIASALLGWALMFIQYVWDNVIKPISWTNDLVQHVSPTASLPAISEYSTIALKMGLLCGAFFVMLLVFFGMFAYGIYRNRRSFAAYAAILFVGLWIFSVSRINSDFQASVAKAMIDIAESSIQTGWLPRHTSDNIMLIFESSFSCYLVLIPVILAVAALTLAMRQEEPLEHLQSNYRLLVMTLYVSAVLLGLVTAVVTLMYRTPATLLDSDAAETYRRAAADWSSYFGVVNSLIIAVATLPAFALFRWQLDRRLTRDNPNATRAQKQTWLSEQGFSLSFSKVISAAIAIASPSLVSSQINLSGLG